MSTNDDHPIIVGRGAVDSDDLEHEGTVSTTREALDWERTMLLWIQVCGNSSIKMLFRSDSGAYSFVS